MLHLFLRRLGSGAVPDLSEIVLLFFVYSLLGYIMECIVVSIECRRFVANRGFARHLPFCVIYGFGAILGYALVHPIRNNLALLFICGAVGATVFEYFVGMLQIRLFGDFWWDYTQKPLNYRGIICLESTLGWGVLAILIVRFLHGQLVALVRGVPGRIAAFLAFALVMAYLLDFAYSAWLARMQKQQEQSQPNLASPQEKTCDESHA